MRNDPPVWKANRFHKAGRWQTPFSRWQATSLAAIAALAQQWWYLVRLQLGATAATYGVVVSALLALRFLVGEDLVVVALFNTIAGWVTAGTLGGLGLALLAPYRRYWVIWLVPGSIAFVMWHAALFVPGRPLLPPETRDPFVAVTFNVRQGGSSELPASLRDALADLDADFVGLQEIGSDVPLDELAQRWPYQRQRNRIALLSQLPFQDVQFLQSAQEPGYSPLTFAMRAIVTVNQQPVSVYVVHLRRPTMSVRPMVYDDQYFKAGVDVLLDALRHDPNPVLLLCDCNFAPTSESYARLAQQLRDSWGAAGFGPGFTAPVDKDDTPFPIIRSDYIWHSAEFATRAVTLESQRGGSDHLPVRAELGWIVSD